MIAALDGQGEIANDVGRRGILMGAPHDRCWTGDEANGDGNGDSNGAAPHVHGITDRL